ncbi:MAG: hypothetical protein M1828_004216 [Chrysothrix sp. TS-e1954]|nr:MAG: hypothetical protein M1828_004216 [Chrysothrix sp. TS-e1954]
MHGHSVEYSIISATLPFLEPNAALAYTPAVNDDGSITVYTGDCRSGPGEAGIWQFTPKNGSNFAEGFWTQKKADTNGLSSSQENIGPNYLAAAATFATTKGSSSSMYTFGGMCPFSNSSAEHWTTDATYSNSMLVLSPDMTDSSVDFLLDTGIGQPIAEAGFSMVPLTATYSEANDESQSQYQDFLLVGGHTQQAFINMSQVAVFSLPQATWTFLPVDPVPSNEDLKVRSSGDPEVEPRSGHTALLTSDGSKVIVFGGWVGDISTPAEPFLAVLELGAGYGGTGAWSWTEASPVGLPYANGNSVYGHGAVMLPGDIMFVMGGFSIPGTSASRMKRETASQMPVDQNLFFNVSSGQWLASYDPSSHGQATPLAKSGLLVSKQQKVGLGVGLSLGLVAAVLALLAGWWLSRKLKRIRQQRHQELEDIHEKEIDDLGILAQTYQPNALGVGGIDGRGGGAHAGSVWDGRGSSAPDGQGTYPWTGNAGPDNLRNTWHSADIRSAERTGLDLDTPSPRRGFRRSLSGRPIASKIPALDGTKRLSHGSGAIHVIEERDEDDEGIAEDAQTEDDDPFRDPSPPPSPIKDLSSSMQAQQLRRSPTKSSFHAPIYSMDALSHFPSHAETYQEQHSPTKSNPLDGGRTGSNLSEYSLHSATSSKSKTTSSGESRGPSRTHSNARSSRMLGRLGSPSPSPTHDSQRPKTPGDSESFRSAYTNLAESEGLLSSSPSRSRPHSRHLPQGLQLDTLTTANTTANINTISPIHSRPSTAPHHHYQEVDETLPSFNPQPDSLPTFTSNPHNTSPTRSTSRVVGSWVGSVRRIIANANATTTPNGRTTSLTSSSQTRVFGDGLGGLMDYAAPPAAPPLPPDAGTSTVEVQQRPSPRRSASDSSRLLLAGSGAPMTARASPEKSNTADWEDDWVSTPERREREREEKKAKRKSEGSALPTSSLFSAHSSPWESTPLHAHAGSGNDDRRGTASPVQDIARERGAEERRERRERFRVANAVFSTAAAAATADAEGEGARAAVK